LKVRFLAVLGLSLAVSVPVALADQAGVGATALNIAQLQYDGGGDWYANPTGLPNLLRTIRDRTGLPVADRPGRIRLTDAELWSYPFLYMTGHGNIAFTDEEVRLLRRYLLEGGFLHVDDNYGLNASFRREISRVFPDRELQAVPPDHPVFHIFYRFPQGLPKVHEHAGKPPEAWGIFDRGRLVLFYSYESDLGNGWEDADVHGTAPELREAALRMGVNLFLHALAQVVP
jgi:hypothetical protein